MRCSLVSQEPRGSPPGPAAQDPALAAGPARVGQLEHRTKEGPMSDDPIDPFALGEVIEDQIAAQGVASLRAKDGQVFVFTVEKLLEMVEIARSKPNGRLVLFVQAGPSA